jgi:enoyl-CoA hydratase/carnithine racemase
MADAEIITETMGRVALIRLNRPQQLNALTYRMMADIRRLVAEAEKDPEVTAIAFVGEGRGFCSGIDAEVLRATTEAGESRRSDGEGGGPGAADPPGIFSYLPQVSKPVIAAVNGVAAGAGFVLAMMSDLRFGSEAASFTTIFSKRGLIAEHGTSWVLPRLLGPSRALDLLWSSRRVDAAEALQMGLLNRVTTMEGLLPAVVDYADQLASQISPSAIAVMKSQVWRHLSEPMLPALADADALTQAQLKHPDAREGALSLIERRPPKFEPWAGGA